MAEHLGNYAEGKLLRISSTDWMTDEKRDELIDEINDLITRQAVFESKNGIKLPFGLSALKNAFREKDMVQLMRTAASTGARIAGFESALDMILGKSI